MKKSKKQQNRFEKLLDIPRELITANPKITMIGFDEIIIENYKGILEYEEYYIKINTHVGIVNINGFNLKLEQMTEDNLSIKGKIETIDFEEN